MMAKKKFDEMYQDQLKYEKEREPGVVGLLDSSDESQLWLLKRRKKRPKEFGEETEG